MLCGAELPITTEKYSVAEPVNKNRMEINMDPYQILGISPNASDEEVKNAYRRLSQQYHPDMYSGNSVMEEIANQKMADINAAYDKIMNMRRGAQASGSTFTDIRRLIESGRYTDADTMLENDRQDMSGEWNFLKGTVCLSRGWMNDAYTYYEKAVRLEPSNGEYRAAFNQMVNRRNGQMHGNPYNTNSGNMDTANCLCNACQCLMCTNCLCDCLNCV